MQLFAPFGSSRSSQGTIPTTYNFTGQYNDLLTQLDYYGARYYDPFVGVFISADEVQGNPDGMNPYNYVGENPETFTDPTGHMIGEPGEGGAGGAEPQGEGGDGPGRGGTGESMGGAPGDTAGNSLGSSTSTPTQVTDQVLQTGNTQVTLDPNTGEMTVETENADGSKTFTSVEQGTEEYNRYLKILESQDGGVPDEGANAVAQGEASDLQAGGQASDLNSGETASSGPESNSGEDSNSGQATSIKLYRGTRLGSDLNTFNETGFFMSDAARQAYYESGGDMSAAMQASQVALEEQVRLFGSLEYAAQAHSAFGLEIGEFGVERAFISFTTDENIARNFAGPGGSVFEATVLINDAIAQTLPGAGEAEWLVMHMIEVELSGGS